MGVSPCSLALLDLVCVWYVQKILVYIFNSLQGIEFTMKGEQIVPLQLFKHFTCYIKSSVL